VNYVDLLFIIVTLIFAIWGYFRGGIKEFYSLFSFFISIYIALVLYKNFLSLVGWITFMPESYVKALAFFGIWLIVEVLFFTVFYFGADKLPQSWEKSRTNAAFGILGGGLKALLILSLIFLSLLMLPLPKYVQKSISKSYFSKFGHDNSPQLVSFVDTNFSGLGSNVIKAVAVSPDQKKIVKLGFTEKNPIINIAEEKVMLTKINKARTEIGVDKLVLDDKLSEVALSHGIEMFAGGFLSHLSADGSSPFDRLNKQQISYFFAGENLAIAPDLDSAFNALMESPGHKANILSGDYGKVGIAVLGAGSKGNIYVQEFTD